MPLIVKGATGMLQDLNFRLCLSHGRPLDPLIPGKLLSPDCIVRCCLVFPSTPSLNTPTLCCSRGVIPSAD